MDVRQLVTEHYGAADLADRILGALAATGVDVDTLTADQLAPVEHLHAGFAPATAYLLDRLALTDATRLLDVGCGIGGASRMAARRGAGAVGVDLTPEFVATATELTRRTGLAHRAAFRTVDGDGLPFDDDAFDAACMIHVGMNVPDKAALFAEVHRVLAPGARFALFEQMRVGDGALSYPLPWAEDERSSFVETVAEYAAHLTAAGFTVETTEDRTAAVSGPPPAPAGTPGLSPMVLFGPPFAQRIANNVADTQAGRLGAILIVARS